MRCDAGATLASDVGARSYARAALADSLDIAHWGNRSPIALILCAWFPPDEKRLNYNVDYPIRHGIVDNWDNMEKYWQRCIYQYMSCDPEEVRRRRRHR